MEGLFHRDGATAGYIYLGEPVAARGYRHCPRRAYRWRKLIDNGKPASTTELAEAIGMHKSFLAKLLLSAGLAMIPSD